MAPHGTFGSQATGRADLTLLVLVNILLALWPLASGTHVKVTWLLKWRFLQICSILSSQNHLKIHFQRHKRVFKAQYPHLSSTMKMLKSLNWGFKIFRRCCWVISLRNFRDSYNPHAGINWINVCLCVFRVTLHSWQWWGTLGLPSVCVTTRMTLTPWVLIYCSFDISVKECEDFSVTSLCLKGLWWLWQRRRRQETDGTNCEGQSVSAQH